MAKLFLVVFLLSVIGSSLSLKCKQCNNECQKVEDEMCTAPPSGQEGLCLTYKYKNTRSQQSGQILTDKKCVFVPQGKTYACVVAPGEQQVACDTCKSDYCNSASGLYSGIALIGAMLVFLIPNLL